MRHAFTFEMENFPGLCARRNFQLFIAINRRHMDIRTEYGFHILRVDQRQPMKLDAVRAVMANDLAHKEMEAILLNGYKLNAGYFGTTK